MWAAAFLVVVMFVASMLSMSHSSQAQMATMSDVDAVRIADSAGLAAARALFISTVGGEVLATNGAGPYAYSVNGSATPVCPGTTAAGECPYNMTVAIAATGSDTASTSGDDTAQNLQVTIPQHVFAAKLSATVSGLNGSTIAARAWYVTARSVPVPPYVDISSVEPIDPTVSVPLERDQDGCDGTTSCDANAVQARTDTRYHVFLQCRSDGNPADGLCNPSAPATPSVDNHSTQNWQNADANTSGVSR